MSLSHRTSHGTITVPDSVLAQIVRRAAESASGARVRRPRRGLDIDLDGSRAVVSLDLAARYGTTLPDLARDVQSRIIESLRGMCELDVVRVDLTIEELD